MQILKGPESLPRWDLCSVEFRPSSYIHSSEVLHKLIEANVDSLHHPITLPTILVKSNLVSPGPKTLNPRAACALGVLLRRMLGDPSLAATSHVIVDEVHERSVDSDMLLLLLRDLVVSGRAPQLRIILMSATADAELFARYFTSAGVPQQVRGVRSQKVIT